MKNKYSDLTQQEKEVLSAKLNHAISKSNLCMESAQEIIGLAESKGLFDNVKFGHEEVYSQVPDEQQRELID